jgi:hypothetical protein
MRVDEDNLNWIQSAVKNEIAYTLSISDVMCTTKPNAWSRISLDNSRSIAQEMPLFSWQWKVHFRVHISVP